MKALFLVSAALTIIITACSGHPVMSARYRRLTDDDGVSNPENLESYAFAVCIPIKEKELIKRLGTRKRNFLQEHTPISLCQSARNKKKKIEVAVPKNSNRSGEVVVHKRRVWVLPEACSSMHGESDDAYHLGTGTRCPWKKGCDSLDNDRFPPVMFTASCRQRGNESYVGARPFLPKLPCPGAQHCQPVQTKVWVLKRNLTSCDSRGREIWHDSYVEINTACGCPRF